MMGERGPVNLTDAEKIDWLWRARDRDHARIAGLVDEVTRLEVNQDRLQRENHRLRETIKGQAEYITTLSRNVNEANERARSAVQEYIEQTKG